VKIPGSPGSLRPRLAEEPAINDWLARDAQCFEVFTEITTELNKDLAEGKITVEEFNELWADTQSDFEACRALVVDDQDNMGFPEIWEE